MAGIKASEINGMCISRDAKGRTIYSNPYTKKNYYISNGEARMFFYYSNRALLCIIAGLVYSLVYKDRYLIGILLGVGMYVVLTLLFQIFYIRKLPEYKGTVERERLIDTFAKDYTEARLYTIMGLCILFIAMNTYNVIRSGYTGFNLYGNIVVMVLIGAFAVICVLALIKKKKSS